MVEIFAMPGVQGRKHVLNQPPTQGAVLGDVMVDKHGEHSGFAEQQAAFPLLVGLQPRRAGLIGIELQRRALVQALAHEAGKV